MRIAVLVSGAFNTGNPKGDLVKNNTVLKSKFPDADFYYGTWINYKDDFEKALPNEKCDYFPEPFLTYHPYDIEKKDHISSHYQATVDWVNKGGRQRRDWTMHHTKQILIHSWMLDKIEKDYDIIIRTRFDAFVYKDADFSEYLEDTLTNHRANCFATANQNLFDKLSEHDANTWEVRLMDQLIIHPANAIDTSSVYSLHDEKKLHAAEFGWYQVISMPHGSNHRNYTGWVNHDKKVPDRFLNV